MARYLRAVVEVIAEGLLTEDFIIVTVHLLFHRNKNRFRLARKMDDDQHQAQTQGNEPADHGGFLHDRPPLSVLLLDCVVWLRYFTSVASLLVRRFGVVCPGVASLDLLAL